MAKLYFSYGPMNSGKTIELLRVAHNYQRNMKRAVIVKPSIDTKGDDRVISRMDDKSRRVDILAKPETDIQEEIFQRKVGGQLISCVLVDEAQFLSTIQVEQLHYTVIDENIPVMAWGLRTDFQTQMFEGAKRLFELAHVIDEVRTVCECEKLALFNARKVNGKFVQEGDSIAIDGEQNVTYEPLCPHCYKLHVGSVAVNGSLKLVA